MIFLTGGDPVFVQNVNMVVGFILLCGGVPALIKFLGSKICAFIAIQSAKKDFGNSTFDKYRYCVEMRNSEKNMLKGALLTKVTLFSLFFVGLFLLPAGALNIFGLNEDTAETIGIVGCFMAVGFFVIYALRFYISGGWSHAGRVYNSWYKKYLPPDIVITVDWERVDGGAWEKKGETREDRNAFSNFMIFVRNLFVFLIKLAMAITYVALYILDDIYIVFRHVIFYKIVEIYYRKKAEKYYAEFIEQYADMNCLKICNSFYTDEKLNSIAHSVHKKYQRKTIECVKNGSESFIVFASDMSVDSFYTNSRVTKLIGSSKYGDKTIYVYEGYNCRVYVCSNDTPEPDNPFGFFAHAFPEMTTDEEYLSSLLQVSDMIGYLRLYQNVFLSLVKESSSSDSTVSLYKIDEETRTIAIISAQLKDIEVKPLPELTEENASKAFTDNDFYTIKSFKTLHELSLRVRDKDEPEQKSIPESKKIENGAFSVYITECGENKIKLIKVVRKYLERGISEVKNMLEATPVSVLDAVSEETASKLVSELIVLGAKAEIKETPADVTERVKAEREKARQELIAVGDGEIIDYDYATDNVIKKNVKSRKTPFALSLFSVLLFLGYLGTVGVLIYSAVTLTPLPSIVYTCSYCMLCSWVIVRTISKASTFPVGLSSGKRILCIVLSLLSNVIVAAFLSCVPFFVSVAHMSQEEANEFFKPMENLFDNLGSTTTYILIVCAQPLIFSPLIFGAIVKKLTNPKK